MILNDPGPHVAVTRLELWMWFGECNKKWCKADMPPGERTRPSPRKYLQGTTGPYALTVGTAHSKHVRPTRLVPL